MTQSYVSRRYKKGDEKDIFKLIKLCYSKFSRNRIENWSWKLGGNPHQNYVWVVETDGQIVAHCTNVAVNLKVGENILKSCVRTGAMTHPEFRRRGLQWKVYSHADNELAKEGIYFAFGFPRNHVFLKHKRKEATIYTCKLPVLIKIIDTNEIIYKLIKSKFIAKALSVWINPLINLLFRIKKNPPNKDLKIKRILKFDDRINDFWKDASRQFRIISVRSKEYLNWRYFKKPNSNFHALQTEENSKILGYIIYQAMGKSGFIVDLLVYPPRKDVIQSLISMAVTHLQQEKVKRIKCLMQKNNYYYSILRANGFIPYWPILGFGVDIWSPSKVPIESLKNPNNWYLTFGDSI